MPRRRKSPPAPAPAERSSPPSVPVDGAALATPEQYNAFVTGIDLRFLRLAHCEIDARARYDGGTLSPIVTEGSAAYSTKDDGFIVFHELIFDARPADPAGSRATVRATFEIEYTSETPMTDPLFALFRAHNLPVNVWPFFREFVNTALGRVAWPPYLLPALKILPGGRPRRTRSAAANPVPAAE